MRLCLVIAGFAAVALVSVYIRAEQVRCASRILQIESSWVSHRRELWTLQVRAARLRSPQQVHERSIYLQANVIPPDDRYGLVGDEYVALAPHHVD